MAKNDFGNITPLTLTVDLPTSKKQQGDGQTADVVNWITGG